MGRRIAGEDEGGRRETMLWREMNYREIAKQSVAECCLGVRERMPCGRSGRRVVGGWLGLLSRVSANPERPQFLTSSREIIHAVRADSRGARRVRRSY